MKFRNVIFWMHLIVGIVVGAVILIMSVTGAMLAFESQIVAFAERNVRIVSKPEGDVRPLTLKALMATASAAESGKKPSAIMIKADPAASVSISFGRDGSLYLNPYTGQVLGGESKMHEFMHQVETWHRWLGMEGTLKPIGHNIKGVCNLAFLFLIVTGFYLWWPKSWRWPGIRNIVLFNPQAKGKARDWNWHNVIGFWCAPVLIAISLTGLIMTYQWANGLLFKMAGSRPPVASEKAGGGNLSGIDVDALFASAQKQEPDWHTMSIRAGKDDAPVTIMIREKSSPYPTPRSTMKLDAQTAEVKSWEPVSGQDLGRRLRLYARYLHTGEVYGVFGQTIACVAALGASMLVWTGFAMAWQRFSAWRQRRLTARS